jgi:hypothetical protein
VNNNSSHHGLGRDLLALAEAMAPQGRLNCAGLVAVTATIVGRDVSASLTVLPGRGAPRTLAATDQLPRDVDALQYSLREGPCLEAIETDDVALTGDLRHDDRWPSFGPACAAQFGVYSMLGVRLMLDGPERGALNLYAPTPHDLTRKLRDLAVQVELTGDLPGQPLMDAASGETS